MNLPADFNFSQHNLQDYLDCPRRFELRYVLKMAWPAIRSEPVQELERRMRLGEGFHQMLQQYTIGIPEDVITSQATELELEQWWSSYLSNPPADLPRNRYAELELVAPFLGYRLVAKYDLLAIDPGGEMVIVDWKTNLKPVPLSALKNRAQTRLYPFLLSLAGAHLNADKPVRPEQISMIYWFTADPARPVEFTYSQAQFQTDQEFLTGIIHEIETQPAPFLLTEDTRQCLYCNYRSLCNRGLSAGRDAEAETVSEEDSLAGFNYDQIAEIEF